MGSLPINFDIDDCPKEYDPDTGIFTANQAGYYRIGLNEAPVLLKKGEKVVRHEKIKKNIRPLGSSCFGKDQVG